MKKHTQFLILGLSFTLLTQGCNPHKTEQPSKEQLLGAVANTAPAFVTVKEVVPEYLLGASANQWTINVKATIAPKEDLLCLPQPAEVAEFNDLIERNNQLIDWRNDFLRTHHSEEIPPFNMETFEIPQVLHVQTDKQSTLAVYGTIRAEKQVDRWNLSTRMDFPQLGRPLGAFGSGNSFLIAGTPLAQNALQNLRKVIESNEAKKKDCLQTLARIEKEKLEKIESEQKALRDKVRRRFATGTKFTSPYQIGKRTITAVIEVLSYDTDRDTFDASIYDAADPSFSKAYLGTVSREKGRNEITDQGVVLEAKGKEGPLPSGLNTPPMFEATNTVLRFRCEGEAGLRGGVSNLFKSENLFFKRVEAGSAAAESGNGGQH